MTLTFNITGFFDFVSHPHLLNTMHDKNIPVPLVKWVASFLSDHCTTLILDSHKDEMRPTLTGIPQGSCVSPILATYFSAPLIDAINSATKTDNLPSRTKSTILTHSPKPTNTILYIDDGNILIISKSIETNIKLARYSYLAAEKWTKDRGLSLDPAKTGLIHFTRSKQAHLDLHIPT
jgi:retron-type reverse transcriptase